MGKSSEPPVDLVGPEADLEHLGFRHIHESLRRFVLRRLLKVFICPVQPEEWTFW